MDLKKRPLEASPDSAVSATQKGRLGATRANILVTGTPGTGKTEVSKAIASSLNLSHMNVGTVAKELDAYEGWDESRQCHILNEDKVLDYMEPLVGKNGGYVVDYHACDLFPERWFDLVLVLRTTTQVLFDRLAKRNYAQSKISENVQCEIMQILLDEAKQSYPPQIVVELQNNTRQDLEGILDRVQIWYKQWIQDHPSPPS